MEKMCDILNKILKFLLVIQSRKTNVSGKIYVDDRLNPFNPLSYILFFVICLFAVVVCTYKQLSDIENPFKWS